jgi:hypothetical protein
MANMKREYEKQYTFHEVIARDDHSETVKLLRKPVDIPEQALVHVPNERSRAVVDAFIPLVKSDYKQVGKVIEALYGIGNACEYEDALERLEIILDSYSEAKENK